MWIIVCYSVVRNIMFIGIIEFLGIIIKLDNCGNDIWFIVFFLILDMFDVLLGDSIVINGVCLMVIEMGVDYYCVDVLVEMIKLIGFVYYGFGFKVNLEKVMCFIDRLGGYIVFGYVDGVGEISKIIKYIDYIEFWVKVLILLVKYIVYKGSIMVDGISLIVNEVSGVEFMLWIILYIL